LIFLQELTGHKGKTASVGIAFALLGVLFVANLIYQPFYTQQMNQLRSGFLLMSTGSCLVSLIMSASHSEDYDTQSAGLTVLIVLLIPSFLMGYYSCNSAFKKIQEGNVHF
jgi:hypothetical protein